MLLHATATLLAHNIYDAARAAGMTGVDATIKVKGSRSHARAFDVKLTGTSGRRPNSGRYGATDFGSDDHAATWDEWGMFLAALYAIDETIMVPRIYADAADFHFKTGNRFKTLEAADQCRNHRWEHAGRTDDGAHNLYTCNKCDANMARAAWGA